MTWLVFVILENVLWPPVPSETWDSLWPWGPNHRPHGSPTVFAQKSQDSRPKHLLLYKSHFQLMLDFLLIQVVSRQISKRFFSKNSGLALLNLTMKRAKMGQKLFPLLFVYEHIYNQVSSEIWFGIQLLGISSSNEDILDIFLLVSRT